MAASILAQVRRDLDGGRVADAAWRLAAAAGRGEVEAVAELAQWRIAGDIVPRDLAAARDLLRQAGQLGDRATARLHVYFLAGGVGGDSDWGQALAMARRLAAQDVAITAQLRLVDAMALDNDGFPAAAPVVETLGDRPSIMASRAFLTAQECDYLRGHGASALRPAVVVDPASGRMVPHPVRVSDGMAFGVYGEDLAINAINRRIAVFSGTRIEQGEPLQLLRYRAGGEYRPHMDAIGGELNQRILTMLIYLSDDYEGGATEFPRLGLTFRGRKGDALLFRNADDAGRPDPRSLHAGLPVTKGEKLIATRWIRRSRFVFPPPRPLLPDFG